MARCFACITMLLLAACGTPDRLLLLITVDTLRADHLGSYGNPGDVTPHLDVLAAQSLRFSGAYAPAPFTLASTAAMLAGRYPEELGIYNNLNRLPDDVPTLATLLREGGWRTGAVVSNYVLRASSGVGRGFEIYDDRMEQAEAIRHLPERRGHETTDAALAVLDRLRAEPGDAFLWVHYQDPHGPYTPPKGYRERYLEREQERADGRRKLEAREEHSGQGGIPAYQYLPGEHEVAFYRAGYAGEVRFMDEQVGRLLAGVEERGLTDRSIIVFTADHGEGLGERDYWFAHGDYLTDPLVRIPLLIRVPGRPGGVRDDVVGLVDLLPTLLALVDAADGEPPGSGRDFLSSFGPEESSAVYLSTLGESSVLRRGLVVGDYILEVSRQDDKVRAELHKRSNKEADVAPSLPELARGMLARLAAIRSRTETREPQRREGVTKEDLARFKALGYVE